MEKLQNRSYAIPEPLENDKKYDIIEDMVSTIQTPRDTVSNVEFAQFQNSADNAFSDLLGGNNTKKKGFQNEGFQVGDAYDRLSDGTYSAKYENFLQGTDNEDRLAKEQGTGEQWRNGIAKFWGKTATAIGGGTLGTLYGLGDAVVSGDWTAIYDNDFYDVMDDWNKQMDNGLSNYYTKEQREMGFLESAGTANFWANDFLGGLSFTVGAIASESIWAAATGGASLVTAAGRYGLKAAKGLSSIAKAKSLSGIFTNTISKGKAINKAINYGRTASLANTARIAYTSAGYEAGVESRMFKQEQEEAFDNYFKELGREATPQERSEFTESLNNKTNAVFATNMALVGSSNVIVFGKLFNVGNPLKSTSNAIKRTLFGEGVELVDNVLKPVKRNITQRVAGTSYHAFKNPIVEGVFEEGGQAVTTQTAGNLIESMYNVDKDVMDFTEAFYDGLAHTYGTKEGRKEVFLGMLIGAVGGGGSSAMAGQNPFANIKDAAGKVSQKDIARIEQYEKGVGSKEVANLLTGAYGNEVSKKVIAEIVRANGLSSSTKQMEEAVKSGDLHNYEQGRVSGILSNVIYAENTGLADLVEEQIVNEIDNTPKESFENHKDDNFDLDVVKEKAKKDYKTLKQEFSKAKEFSNYVIGNLGKKEEKFIGQSTETLRTMLAYQQVMTNRTLDFAEELNTSMIDIVGEYVGQDFQSLKSASEIKLALDKAEKGKTRDFYNTNRRLKTAVTSYDNTTKQIELQAEQLTSTPEDQQAKTAKLLKLQNKQKELLEQKESLRTERDLLLQTIRVQTNSNRNREDTSVDLTISEDIDNLEENLEKISNTIEDISKRDYEKYVKLKSATTAYQKSINSAKQMAEIMEDLTNDKTQLKGQTRTFLNTAKEYSEPSERLIKNLQDVFDQRKQEVEERDNIREVVSSIKTEEEITLDPLADDAVNDTKIDAINIEQAINDILSKYEGLVENLTDPEAVKPTEDDFNRYIELINQSKVNSDLLLKKSYENASKRVIDKTGLNKEEIKEFQDLSKKLADWQIISGMTNEEVSLKDLLDQKLAMQKEVSKTTTSPITPEQEAEMIQGVVNERTTNEMNAKNINTSDSVLVQKKNGKYNISHFKVEKYDESIEIVKIKKATKKKDGLLTFKKGEEEFTVGTTLSGRYIIDNEEDFNKFLDILDLKVMSFKGQKNTWSAMYSKNEEGEYELQDSHFEVNLIDSADINIIDSQKLYNIKPGEKVFFKVSLKDSYNTTLINDPKVTKEKLIENASILVVNENGDALGQIKASNSSTEHTDKTKAIREQAGNFIWEQIDPERARTQETGSQNISGFNVNTAKGTTMQEIVLPFYTTVTRVYTNSPSVKLDSNGEVIQQAIPEGKIESYGIYKDGKIILNGNSKVKVEDVSRTYLKTIGNTPIIIVKVGKKSIAYPAQIKPKQEDLGNNFMDMLDSIEFTFNKSESDKIVSISKFLADNGISPTKYNLRHIGADNSSLYDGTMERIIEDIEGIATYVSEEEFLSKEFTPNRLEEEVTTSLNLSDRPFRNPKLEIDAKGIDEDENISDKYYERQLNTNGNLPNSYLEKIASKLDIDLKPIDKLTTFNKKVLSLYKDEINNMVQERLKMTPTNQAKSKSIQKVKCKG